MALRRRQLPLHRCVAMLITCVVSLILYALFWHGDRQLLQKSLWKQTDSSLHTTVLDDNDRKALDILGGKLEKERRIMENEAAKGSTPIAWTTDDPLRVVLLSSWRSGSTLLGRILSNHSATFNWYEPLMPFTHQVSQGPMAEEAVSHLQSLFHCRCPDRYMDYIRNNTIQMTMHNPGILDVCLQKGNFSVCQSRSFLETSCSKFPVQLMKLVRFRVDLMERFLSDPSLARLKVIHLVRDPRAMMNSRWKLKWCSQLPDCTDPQLACDLLLEDLQAFDRLSSKFQGRMMQVRYEDMALDPVKVIRNVFDFAGLQFTQRVENAVNDRTTLNGPDIPWYTQRKSQERIDLWKKELSPQRTAHVERSCFKYINKLGYPLNQLD